MFKGRLYDGVTGHPHAVSVELVEDALILAQLPEWQDQVSTSLLKRVDAGGGGLRLARSDRPGWRLTLPAEAISAIAPLLGREEKYGRWIDRAGLVPGATIAALIASAVLAIGYVAPEWIAPHVPMRWERDVGGAIVGDYGKLRCRNAVGQRALEALVERVAPGSTRGADGIKVAALDVRMFNAAALPGGYIVVFKPAITETTPDALAGVLAHEVAHVRRRHVTEALIRELGVGALIRLFAGNIGANADQLVSLSYTRSNEAQADSDSIEMLKRAAISPRPTAELFARLAKETPEFSAQFLNSHPLSSQRAQKFAASFDQHARYTPALSQTQAKALAEICTAGAVK